METNNLMERIQAELGYSIAIPTTPQQATPVKTKETQTTEKTTPKQQISMDSPEWIEHLRRIGMKKGETRNPKGRPKKPKDILEAMDDELEKIRSLNPDGTPGKTAAQIIAQNAIDKAVIDKDLDAIKWITERKHGKVPNTNINQNTNIDLSDILNQARGIKIVENLDNDTDEDGEPTVVEVK